MTAISNDRTNPWTGATSFRDAEDTDYEEHTVAEFDELPGIFGVQLQDHCSGVSVGLKRLSGLVISSITNPAGNTYRYNFSGSPNLSTVVVGDYLHAKDCTASANNVKKVITAVSDGSDYIEVTNASGVAQVGAAGEVAVSSTQYTQVSSGSPGVLQYRPDYTAKTGKVLFHDDESSNVVIVNYQAGGTVGTAARIIKKIAIIADVKAQNTAGGTFTSGADRTRDLNTEIADDIGVSISSNRFTLPPGKYYIHARCPVYNVDRHICKLYNFTTTTVVRVGTSGFDTLRSGYSEVFATVEIAVASAFEIQHVCETTEASDGFGVASNLADETYTVVYIEKLG